jgi:hypothetical protein
MSERREAFLAGELPEDVALYLSDSFVDDPGALGDHGELVEGGVLLVVDGDAGRSVFRTATGSEAMTFTKEAMDRESPVDRGLTGGTCPDAGNGGDHEALFLFAFAEEQHEEVGGIYAEGDVMHAYARCDCGASYSDRWVVGE